MFRNSKDSYNHKRKHLVFLQCNIKITKILSVVGKHTFIQAYFLRHEKAKYRCSTIEVKEPAICCHSHKRCDTKGNFDAQCLVTMAYMNTDRFCHSP